MRLRTHGLAIGIGLAGLIGMLAAAPVADLDAQGQGFGGGRGRAAGPGGPGGGPGGPMGRRGGPGGPGGLAGIAPGMLERLNLTDAQRENVRSVMDSYREEQGAIGDRIRTAHQALETAIAADAFDEGLVRTKAADEATAESDAAVVRARIYQEVVQVLTTEQRTQLKELQAKMAERQAEMEQRWEERGPQRGGR